MNMVLSEQLLARALRRLDFGRILRFLLFACEDLLNFLLGRIFPFGLEIVYDIAGHMYGIDYVAKADTDTVLYVD